MSDRAIYLVGWLTALLTLSVPTTIAVALWQM
jgi:hypothetical protein